MALPSHISQLGQSPFAYSFLILISFNFIKYRKVIHLNLKFSMWTNTLYKPKMLGLLILWKWYLNNSSSKGKFFSNDRPYKLKKLFHKVNSILTL